MKDITIALLASLFVLMSLVSMISADPTPKGTRWAALSSPGDMSELEAPLCVTKIGGVLTSLLGPGSNPAAFSCVWKLWQA